jgi:hypothetical protein
MCLIEFLLSTTFMFDKRVKKQVSHSKYLLLLFLLPVQCVGALTSLIKTVFFLRILVSLFHQNIFLSYVFLCFLIYFSVLVLACN